MPVTNKSRRSKPRPKPECGAEPQRRVSRYHHSSLRLMPEKVGLNEIAFTQLKSHSFNFVAQDQETGYIRKKAQKIEPTAYDPSLDVQLKAPFKLWDPRTW